MSEGVAKYVERLLHVLAGDRGREHHPVHLCHRRQHAAQVLDLGVNAALWESVCTLEDQVLDEVGRAPRLLRLA